MWERERWVDAFSGRYNQLPAKLIPPHGDQTWHKVVKSFEGKQADEIMLMATSTVRVLKKCGPSSKVALLMDDKVKVGWVPSECLGKLAGDSATRESKLKAYIENKK